MIRVLAVDPGKMTGLAILTWDEDKDSFPKVEFSTEVSEENFPDEVLLALDMINDKFFVTCEKFTINMQTAKNTQAPWSLEMIGVLKYLCRIRNYPVDQIEFQAPANAKSMFPNPSLKQFGTWHRGGAGHANDAIRHGMLRMVKAGWVPRRTV